MVTVAFSLTSKGQRFQSIHLSLHAGLPKVACASSAGNMVCEVCKAVRSAAVISMSKHYGQDLEKCRELRVWTFYHSTQRKGPSVETGEAETWSLLSVHSFYSL